MAKLVYFSGNVQGVGFRATTARIARMHPLVRGWVGNLPDGRVEVVADGTPYAIEAFLTEVRERMAENITSEEVMDVHPNPPPSNFRIVY